MLLYQRLFGVPPTLKISKLVNFERTLLRFALYQKAYGAGVCLTFI